MGTANSPSFHEDALSASVRSVLRAVAPLASRQGFYLAGGTAVALHLGHRRSRDLDWFREAPLTQPLQLAEMLREHCSEVEVTHVEQGTLLVRVSGVRVSFFEYRYPLMRPPLLWEKYGFLLASLEDLACMKLLAIAQRGTKRDFVDLYALMQAVPLLEALRLYQQKYGVSDITHLLRALTYFEDADRERMPTMLQPIAWREVKRALRETIKQLT